jgi:DNA gyrase subunit B
MSDKSKTQLRPPGKSGYTGDSIVVLDPMEAVRLRPAMYVGDAGERGMHHLVWEVVDNAVDEAMQGHCSKIVVELSEDGRSVAVEDDGRGIPVDKHPKDGRSALEVVMTVLHAGGKFGKDESYAESGGLHGVGVSCVNALSESTQVTVWRKDSSAGETGCFTQSYACGKPTGAVKRLGAANRSGTRVAFTPDFSIFKTVKVFDPSIISRRLREVAHLNPNLTVVFKDGTTGKEYTFLSTGGIAGLLADFTQGSEGLYPAEPIVIEGRSSEVTVKLAMQYRSDDDESLHSYANNIHTPEGGTHLSGFKRALTTSVNSLAKSKNLIKDGLQSDDIRDGLVLVLAVRLRQPEFEGQTKGRLSSAEAESGTAAVVAEKLGEYFERNPQFFTKVVERALLAQKAREAAKREADVIKRKGLFGKQNRLPGKLKDCNTEDRNRSELFIVEGDSAAGAATDGRNPESQAILPLRGKIMNAEKHDLVSILKNEEVKALVMSAGTGIDIPGKEKCVAESRRYEKFIIMADADVDGGHIETLLLALFYRYMRPLVEGGHVYLAVPPLYRVDDGKTRQYCWSDEELRKATGKAKSSHVTRYKGLGEMNAEELAETTMDPLTRKLIRVSVPDVSDAEETLSMFMGKAVSRRKSYLLEKSAEYLEEPIG